MWRAVLDNIVLAEAPTTVAAGGRRYFFPSSVRWEHLQVSPNGLSQGAKGPTIHFEAVAGSRIVPDVAWSYLDPPRAFAHIKRLVAFGPEVTLVADKRAARRRWRSSQRKL